MCGASQLICWESFCSSLGVVYDEIMNSMVSAAQDHVNIADALTSQVVEVLRVVGRKSEESRKKVLSPPLLKFRVFFPTTKILMLLSGGAILSETSG